MGQGTERGECEREVTFNVKVEATEHDGEKRDGKQVGDPAAEPGWASTAKPSP